MGSYTNYELDIKDPHNRVNEMVEYAKKTWEEDYYGIAFLIANSHMEDSCKWYNHVDDMCKLSKAFPEARFQLFGEGEEAGDIWHEYYLDGKYQICRAKMEFDEFDENKLEEI